jgi:hypothetical protein
VHGLGRLKLLREHIKEDVGDDLSESTREMLEQFDLRVNLERDELTQTVNLGAFTSVSQQCHPNPWVGFVDDFSSEAVAP